MWSSHEPQTGVERPDLGFCSDMNFFIAEGNCSKDSIISRDVASVASPQVVPYPDQPTLEDYTSDSSDSDSSTELHMFRDDSTSSDSDSDSQDDLSQDQVDFDIAIYPADLLDEIRFVARLRRARNIYNKALADKLLVLLDIERKPPRWEEHSLLETESLRNALTNACLDASGIYDAYSGLITTEIEKVVCLYGALREQGSWTGVASTIMLYVHTHFKGSVLLVTKQVFEDYFSCWEQQSIFGDWMAVLKKTHTNWKMATQNEGFKHVTRMISMLVGAGMLQASNLQCEVNGMKLFSDLCVPKFVSAYDLLDAAMSCVMFFVEGGYECIQQGSLTPLLFGEKDFAKFDDDFMECKKCFEFARPGNYHMIDVDENAVMGKLAATIEQGKRLSQISKNPFSKKMIQDRIGKLQEMESTLQQHRLSGGVREKPFCAVAFGPTGVGKSTIAPLIMYHILQPNGYDASDNASVMMTAGQKHEEEYRTNIDGIYYDDFAQTKAEFTDTSPCQDLLETVNTAKCTARMATLELKSKVSKMPKGVVVSTNVKDLSATKYSEEPAAITRRADVFMTFRVRPQFQTNGMLDSKKVTDHYDGNVPRVPDLWEIDLEISYPLPNPTPGRAAVIGWKSIVWNGKEMKGVDMKTALQYIVVASRVHFEYQRDMVKRSTGLSDQFDLCPNCSSSMDVCVCSVPHAVSYVEQHTAPKTGAFGRGPHSFNPRPGMCVCGQCKGKVKKSMCPYKMTPAQKAQAVREMAFEDACRANTRYDQPLQEHAGIPDVLNYVEWLETISSYKFDFLVPQCLVRSYAMLSVVQTFIAHPNAIYHVGFGFLVPYFIQCRVLALLTFLSYVYFLYSLFMSYVFVVELNVAEQKQSAWHYSKHVAIRTATILASGIGVKMLYDFATNYMSVNKLRKLNEQSFLNPSDDDIKAIDMDDPSYAIAIEHNYANVEVAPLPASQESKTISEEDLVKLVEKNTVSIMKDGKLVSNAFFLKSNVALVPTHLIKKWNDVLCTIVRHDVTQIGGNFKCYLSFQHSAQIPNTDNSVIWVPNGGDWKDLTKYFPLNIVHEDFGMRMCTRRISGELERNKSFARHGYQPLVSCQAFGYAYDVASYFGMCGSPIIAQKISPMIMGIHVAGNTAAGRGFASALCQSDIDYAMELLAEQPSVLLCASEGTFRRSIYGKQTLDEQAIHEKSPVNRLEVDEVTPNMAVYGSCSGRATFYSRVVPSLISDAVSSVCGVAQQWSKPKFSSKAWSESLKYSSKPSFGVEPTLMDKAVVDYLKPIYKLLNDRPNLKNDIRPLTRMETICGIDGKKFINKIPPDTAVGYPLTGTKAKHLTYLDPDDFPDFACPAELHHMFWDEFDVAVGAWRIGERYYPTFKSFLKDEPTPVEKTKVRVVQAAPVVLQMGVRMYFLPIARHISLFPELTECAVGLNCMGPDWEEFQAHIKKFGSDRILAGDYSKYDIRMPAQITMAAFKVFISIAEFCGYSEEELQIMRSIATDICYPVVAFNGDLLKFVGTNPSGQNLTVYINSIGNSILMRCAFYSIIKDPVSFRDACAIGTYGDDVKGSVHEDFSEFNHLSVAEFFAQHDMVFTMPDKTSTPIPYMKDCDADFLKRNNVYVPELGQHVGALDENSIFKCLHSNLKSKALTKQELAATCIDGALRDWFFHGRDVYEARRIEMCEVASMTDIDNLCTMLDVPFDRQVARWRHRYLKEPLPPGDSDLSGLECILGDVDVEEQCGGEMEVTAEDMYAPCNGNPGDLLFWEYPMAFALFSIFAIPYVLWMFSTGKITVAPTRWNSSHTTILYILLWTGGLKWFFWIFIFPHLQLWFMLVLYVFVVYY